MSGKETAERMAFPDSQKQSICNQAVYRIIAEVRSEAALYSNTRSAVYFMSHLDQLTNSFELWTLLPCGDYDLSPILL